MQTKHVSIYILVILSIIGCDFTASNDIHGTIDRQTDLLFSTIVKQRRDFHQYPELAGNEIRTSRVIATYLKELDLEVLTDVGGHGVIGILNGEKPGAGKNIAWRADMDAIPIELNEDVNYKSNYAAINHGCGHDVHMSIALGMATILSQNREAISGTIYFIFQPEEETFVGANAMTKDPAFIDLKIDEIYTTHVTAFPNNEIVVKPIEVFAYQKQIKLTLSNSISNKEIDSLYNFISSKIRKGDKNLNSQDLSIAFDSLKGIKNLKNNYQNYRYLEKNYAIDFKKHETIIKSFLYHTNRKDDNLYEIEEVLQNSEYSKHLIDLAYIQSNPTVLNNELLTTNSIETINSIYGTNTIISSYGQIPYFNDDFVYFQNKIPGVYFLLGGSDHKKGIKTLNHTSQFKVDEQCMKTGIKVFSSLILERSNQM